jgi:sarcosine oxidase delta subunit
MLYLDHRRHLVPDKWYGGTSQTFSKTHVKERCGGGGVSGMGCGLWKTKGQPCPHCETRPNRSQAKIAQAMHRVSDRNDKWGFRDPTPEKRPSSAAGMTQEIMNEYLYSGDGPKASLHRRSSAGSRDRLMVHTKERCGGGNVSGMGCGMWKTIGQMCPHCEARPNRMQAQAAQDRQEAVELGWNQACQLVPVDSSGTPMGSSRRSLHSQGFEEPATFSVVPGTPQALTHRKERCGGGSVGGMGCGMWKTKGQPCPWCEARPNREQVRDCS